MASPWDFLKRAGRIGTKERLSRNEEEIAQVLTRTAFVNFLRIEREDDENFKTIPKITSISGIFDKTGTNRKQLAVGATVSLAACRSPPNGPSGLGASVLGPQAVS
jgi:hypothetical protein